MTRVHLFKFADLGETVEAKRLKFVICFSKLNASKHGFETE